MFKNYNMNQVVLPLDLERKLQENDIAFAIHELVESIPDDAFRVFYRETGRPAYHPRMMLKILLCGYTQSTFSGRKMEALVQDSVRMMWLAQGAEPSYRSINRFRANPHMSELIRQCFVQFRTQLVEGKHIEEEAIFIDGTKIEANANKFSFVWRKSVDRYRQKLIDKSMAMYDELLQEQVIPEIQRESTDSLSTDEIEAILHHVEETVEAYDHQIENSTDVSARKALRSERKGPKHVRRQFREFVERKRKYDRDRAIFGERNSYSKIDHDATFMRMKDDYMNNGQLKPGYNVQIATENQYTLAYDLYPNPTDTRTLLPFLEAIETRFFELPEYIVADAGYGSEQNYQEVIEQKQRTPLITYSTYRKEQTKKHQKNPYHVDNWTYREEEDTFICPNNQRVLFQNESKKKDRSGFQRTFRIYECEDCGGCPFRSECTTAKEGKNRKVYRNTNWEIQKSMIQEWLSNEKTGSIYRKRKIDVEPVFGNLKANLRFTRFSVRGKAKVHNELGIALMAVNLRKFTVASSSSRLFTNESPTKKTRMNVKWFIRVFYFYSRPVMSRPLSYIYLFCYFLRNSLHRCN